MEQYNAESNQSVARDIKILIYRLNEGNRSKVDEIVGFKRIVCSKIGAGEYKFNKVLN